MLSIPSSFRPISIMVLLTLLVSCGKASDKPAAEATVETKPQAAAGLVDANSIIEADNNPGEWLSHGRTYDEQRFSPLTQINSKNVSELGLAWSYDLPTKRGVEATPLVSDGKMYTTGSWSIVYALDAKTGELLWQFDPKTPKASSPSLSPTGYLRHE